jgi:hypothetical protein
LHINSIHFPSKDFFDLQRAEKMSQLISTAKHYTEQAQDGIMTHDIEEGSSSAQRTGAFPRGGLMNTSADDERMKEKLEFVKRSGGTGMTEFGQVYATDKDFEWLKKKRETEAFANLDAWIGKNFHTPSVSQRKWLQETFPEYYESRERLMVSRAKLALRINLLLLRGPKNHKDLVLQWGLATGRIKLDRNWNVVGAHEDAKGFNNAEEQKRFANGLFSPMRYLSDQRMPWVPFRAFKE